MVQTKGSKPAAYDVNVGASARCGLPTNSSPCGPLLISVAAAPNQDETNLNVILGALVGAAAAACVGLLLFYLKQHPQKAMKARVPTTATCCPGYTFY